MQPPSPTQIIRKLRTHREILLPCLVLAVALYLGLLVACSGTRAVVAPAPTVDGAHFVGSAKCASCHEEISRKFPSSVHARVHPAAPSAGVDTSCESCHGPGSRHVASGGGEPFQHLIVNPGKSPEACLKCHVGVKAQFHLPSHHPVIEGKMNCVDCHDPHGQDIMNSSGSLAFARLNQQCADCHRDQTRKFVFEHEAMREGCITCHHPHGSVNDKMLIQRDANLCLKCHAQVPGANGSVVIGKVDHSFFLRQGSCSTSGCHTAVHGSNIHPRLLH
jgi:predicted CXXCH cytochrome family protein